MEWKREKKLLFFLPCFFIDEGTLFGTAVSGCEPEEGSCGAMLIEMEQKKRMPPIWRN